MPAPTATMVPLKPLWALPSRTGAGKMEGERVSTIRGNATIERGEMKQERQSQIEVIGLPWIDP